MKAHVVTTPEELTEHEERWEALRRECGGTIYSANFMTRSWFQTFSASAAPRVIIIEDNGEAVGIAPLCGYKYKVKGFPVKVLSLAGDMSDKIRLATNSILCLPDRADVLEQMIKEINKLDWSFLWTINMERSASVDNYVERVRSTWNAVECDVNKGLEIPLPAAGELCDAYDSNAKRNFRKLINRLERESVDTRLERIGAEEIDKAVEMYAKQHIERWESKGGSYFRDPENVKFLKASMSEGYARGCGFAYQLLMNGEVAAQVFGFREGKKVFAKRIGMDDKFSRYSPGWLLCNRFLTELRDQGAEECAMGWGGERYKYEMGGRETQLVGIGATRGVASIAARLAFSSRTHGLGSPLGTMVGSGVGTESTSARSLGPGD